MYLEDWDCRHGVHGGGTVNCRVSKYSFNTIFQLQSLRLYQNPWTNFSQDVVFLKLYDLSTLNLPARAKSTRNQSPSW